MRNVITLLAVASLALQTGCASISTVSNRTKTLLLMGGVGAAAAAAGYSLAPQDTRPEMSAAYFGAVGAAVAGAAGLFIFDEQKRTEELDRENGIMRKELAAFRDEGGSSREPQLLYETNAPFGKEIPSEYSGLVKPGHWSVYRLNQWVNQGEGTIIHQDRLVKLVPPQLTPANATDLTEGTVPSAKGPESSDSPVPKPTTQRK